MQVEPSGITGCFVVRTRQLEDARGFFLETQKSSVIETLLGRPHRFAQTNHSRSHAGTLRGFHSEGWDKLIYVARGHALCVVADTRPDSPTFGRHVRFELGDPPGRRDRVFIAEGLSNAFYCHTEVDYLNDVSAEYNPARRGGVLWCDPILAVDWPNRNPILSPTDQSLPTLAELFPEGRARVSPEPMAGGPEAGPHRIVNSINPTGANPDLAIIRE